MDGDRDQVGLRSRKMRPKDEAGMGGVVAGKLDYLDLPTDIQR
ncbi:hypothetical protein KDH_79800 [Dictyobacter sp. S3.2.2.5]|uniref:Uncharacterized protein n=1 Tax=Dictyobacter halimunensis TaxID=3026934 RepID=A0ABQ6G8J9_9CHLR|nr:hypothetical protein KDH_79800 [Dictyobacter sp. S3.2.2.5]